MLQIDGGNVIFRLNMTKLKRFFKESRQHFFLFGPRGTGKSTWLKENYADAGWIDLLDAASYRSYLARPERLEKFVEAHTLRRNIIIDEIQRVPQLLPVVHKLIESNPEIRFIMTGSSARKLRRAGVDLLAGRAIVKKMHPFMASEMGEYFDLETSLKLGLIPLVRSSDEPQLVLQGYINLYLQQEVMAEGLIRNIENFSRFLEAVSFSQGSILNITEIARECEVKRTTVAGYIGILEDLLIARQLPVFSRRAKRALISHTKFYLFDCGVYNSLRPAGPIDMTRELSGPALEGLILQHLQAWIDYSNYSMNIYYWHTRAGSEVDFVIYGKEGFYAIEVKNSEIIRTKHLRSLKTFIQDYPESEAIFLYRGKEILKSDDIYCIPIDIFLKNLIPEKELLH